MPTKMQPQLIRRDELISQLMKDHTYDIAIVGGGATGLDECAEKILAPKRWHSCRSTRRR